MPSLVLNPGVVYISTFNRKLGFAITVDATYPNAFIDQQTKGACRGLKTFFFLYLETFV